MEGIAYNTAAELERLGVGNITTVTVDVTTFESGELKTFITGNVREKDVFLFSDFNGPVHDAMFTCRLTLQALELAGVRSITLIVPYIPYLRQDRKEGGRVPVSATLFIGDIKRSKSVKRIITLHMHCDQVEMLFAADPPLPYDHFPGQVIWRDYAKRLFAGNMDKLVLLAPDIGSFKLIKKLAQDLDLPIDKIGIVVQTREDSGKKIFKVTGPDVTGMTCFLVDDIIDTASTLSGAIKSLFSRGAAEVVACGTHPGFTTREGVSAYDVLGPTGAKIVVTDSLDTKPYPWLEIFPLYPYLAHIIYQNVTDDGSVSKLIKEGLPS